jgi:hypothetical protein
MCIAKYDHRRTTGVCLLLLRKDVALAKKNHQLYMSVVFPGSRGTTLTATSRKTKFRGWVGNPCGDRH